MVGSDEEDVAHAGDRGPLFTAEERRSLDMERSQPSMMRPEGVARIALGAVFIGAVFAAHAVQLGYSWMAADVHYAVVRWCLYACALMAYHLSEFMVTATFHPNEVTFDSFLLFHSQEYGIALAAAWLEFVTECWFWPELKHNNFTLLLGIALVVVGQAFRTAAMVTAGRNFSHIIADQRTATHTLVTTGVYTYLRHPSYFGWFYWAVGTQVLLCNPCCVVVYAVVAWKFFSVRIKYEEAKLHQFFPGAYANYVDRSYIGIPFVSAGPMPRRDT